MLKLKVFWLDIGGENPNQIVELIGVVGDIYATSRRGFGFSIVNQVQYGTIGLAGVAFGVQSYFSSGEGITS